MNNPRTSPHPAHVIIATIVLIFCLLRFMVFLSFSGVFGGAGSGLFSSSPSVFAYISILVAPLALYLFYLGASGKKTAALMWVAVVLLYIVGS